MKVIGNGLQRNYSSVFNGLARASLEQWVHSHCSMVPSHQDWQYETGKADSQSLIVPTASFSPRPAS